jgi:hypothetical protein
MDDWHRKLAADLVAETPIGRVPDGAAALEIGFGHARSAIAYALELALAYRLPATGSVAGDDVWLRLGDARVRFTLSRRDGHVVVARPRQEDLRVRWEETRRVLIDDGGAISDLDAVARGAIGALVADWRAGPAKDKVPSAPPRNTDDEPTKG